MRWFKHMSLAHRDEHLSELISECGLEAYGFYWLLLEVVASSMDKTDRCSVTYPLPQWSRLLYCHHHTVSKYLGKLGVMGRVTVEYVDSKVRVTIPNLLKYRDEYSKKSGEDSDNVRSKKQKQNTDTEAKTELPPKPPAPKTGAVTVALPLREWFEEFWALYWRKEAKGAAEKAFQKKVRSLANWQDIRAAVIAQAPGMLAREPNYRPCAAPWLNQDRVHDEPAPATVGAPNDKQQRVRDETLACLKWLNQGEAPKC